MSEYMKRQPRSENRGFFILQIFIVIIKNTLFYKSA
jgi:hypothetical protein